MNPRRFDAVTARLAAAGPRREVLTALFTGSLAPVFGRSAIDAAAASGKGGKRRGRKKQKPECGEGKPCPPEAPCCFGGRCRPLCGGSCCEDCFAEILLTGQPDLNHPVCCAAGGGSVCSPIVPAKRKKGKKKRKKRDTPADDLCCYPNQVCVNGACCCDGCEAAMVCGGVCCPIAACCNGACCADGQVCANTPNGPACVAENRSCGGGCFAGEVCHGGVCCAGSRVCGNGMGNDFCCAADEYCEFPNTIVARCCPFNTSCTTYRGRRVRV
jgi:hypothetical protein